MTDQAALVSMISSYGMWVLTPLAVLEGPIVTVIAGYLARLSIVSLWLVIPCVIIADLVGDIVLYLIGRLALGSMNPVWRDRLGLSPRRLYSLMRGFRRHGFRILVAAKLTHAAGFAALAAAGAAHMPFGSFLTANLVAGIPKCLFFVALGYLFGSAHETIASWLSAEAAALLLALVVAGGVVIYLRRRRADK